MQGDMQKRIKSKIRKKVPSPGTRLNYWGVPTDFIVYFKPDELAILSLRNTMKYLHDPEKRKRAYMMERQRKFRRFAKWRILDERVVE